MYNPQFDEDREELEQARDRYQEYNRPTGEVWRKYSRIWDAFISDMHSRYVGSEVNLIEDKKENVKAFQERLENNLQNRIKERTRITRDILQFTFSGLIRDWDYLLKVLDIFANAKFIHPADKPFWYEIKDEDTVEIFLGMIDSDNGQRERKLFIEIPNSLGIHENI